MSSHVALRYLSQPRFNVYLARTNNDYSQALNLYRENIVLSESFYPILALLEISLRNAIQATMQHYFNDEYWFNHLPSDFIPLIKQAEQKLQLHKKTVTPDRIVAELSFGFWSRLFNKRYAQYLWKPLRTLFKNMPKSIRKRDAIEESLFRIRRFRNRVYHYEPIFVDRVQLNSVYIDMVQLMDWIDHELIEVIKPINRFDEVMSTCKN